MIQIRDTSNEKMRIQTEAEIKSKLPSSILESCKFIHETKQAMTANVRLHKNVNTGNVRKALNEVSSYLSSDIFLNTATITTRQDLSRGDYIVC